MSLTNRDTKTCAFKAVRVMSRVPLEHFLPGTPRLHYLEWNPAGAPTIVLLHGGSANGWWWQAVADQIGPRPRLLALDQRGHGDSDWVAPPAYAPADYVADLHRLVGALALRAPIIVGHSQGGINALAYAGTHRDVARAVVAIDSPLRSSPQRDRFLKRLRSLPTVVYADLATAQARFRLMPDEGQVAGAILAEIATRSVRPVSGGYTLKFDRESFWGRDGIDVLKVVAMIEVPVLLVRAEHSRLMSAQALNEAVASNPLVRTQVIPAAYHHVLLEQPAAVAELIRGLISEFA